MNLPPDPGKKVLEWQMANFGTNWTFGHVSKTEKANDRTNCVVIGENGPLGAPTGPKQTIIAIEQPN